MKKFLPINLLLLLALIGRSQTVVNSTNLLSGAPSSNDYLTFLKWSGVKYQWYRANWETLSSAWTNSQAGVTLWTVVSGNKSTLTTQSNALQAQITANAATLTTQSNALQSQFTSSLTTQSNALQTQITANLLTATNAFVSGLTNLYTTNVVVAFSHGLSATPSRVRWVLVCQSPEAGYTAGQEISIAALQRSNVAIIPTASEYADTTKVYLSTHGADGVFLLSATGSGPVTLTSAGNVVTNFKLKAYAKP